MKIVGILFIAIVFELISGCSENPVSPNNVSLNSDFKIKYGQSVYIPEEILFISFQDVVEESRCPEGLQCFWQGTAKIKLFIRKGNDTLTDTVETYLPQSVVSIGPINNSYLFDVKNVEPYPKQNSKIDIRNYVLTLNVSHFTYGFNDSEIQNKSGIFGQVFIGPTSPVERAGYIYYKPFQTSFTFIDSQNDSTVVETDSTGRFIVYLIADEYHILQNKELPLFDTSQVFKVTEGKMTYENINCFSGIQ